MWLGLLAIVVSAAGICQATRFALARILGHFDPTTQFGLAGLVGLGASGMVLYFVRLARAQLDVVVLLLCGVFLYLAVSGLLARKALISGRLASVQGVAFACVASIIPLVGVLAPSTMLDWDSLAYHLAVPKMWLADGKIESVSFIHHSNFPFAIDSLNLMGLSLAGQAGAKLFQLIYFWFGLLAIFGLCRERFGAKAAWWTITAFAAIPVVQWEAGSAYVDVSHGLYAGLGALLVLRALSGWEGTDRTDETDLSHLSDQSNQPDPSQSEQPELTRTNPSRSDLLIGAILLGFALGSKYTGLQTLLAVGLVGIFLLLRDRRPLGASPRLSPVLESRGYSCILATAIILAIGLPWYVKNAITVGNPVYPFFYDKLGGKNWNQHQADIYREEQKSFGLQEGPVALAHAVLGLAYQPGRYINPGQTFAMREVVDDKGQMQKVPTGGEGSPLGAVGFPIFLAVIFAALMPRKRAGTPELPGALLAWLALGAVMWFFLSQQSRYALSWAPVCCYLLASVVSTKAWQSRAMQAAVAVQVAITAYVCQGMLLTPERIQAALGQTSESEYLTKSLPFYEAATLINAEKKPVALFDEVFGFYLDVPYFWAGYGHTSELGYEKMEILDQFLGSLKDRGFTRLYLNLAFAPPEFKTALGEVIQTTNSPAELRAEFMKKPETKWRAFVLEGLEVGKLRLTHQTRAGVILDMMVEE